MKWNDFCENFNLGDHTYTLIHCATRFLSMQHSTSYNTPYTEAKTIVSWSHSSPIPETPYGGLFIHSITNAGVVDLVLSHPSSKRKRLTITGRRLSLASAYCTRTVLFTVFVPIVLSHDSLSRLEPLLSMGSFCATLLVLYCQYSVDCTGS